MPPTTESDQEAASPLIDTSPDDSEVGAVYLGLRIKTSKGWKGKEIELFHGVQSVEIIAWKKVKQFSNPVPLDNVEEKDWLSFI